jgi:ADP-heptose:LPS heptosyltransferase/glycosyltransferase involved in cell wall biosynthesis
MKTNVLFVGEHPCGTTGNSQMMRGVLSQVNLSKYQVTCFAVETSRIDFQYLIQNDMPIKVLNAGEENDIWGHNKLLEILRTADVQVLAMIGIDIWRYGAIMTHIRDIVKHRKISWIFLFPYELSTVRKDWVEWMYMVQYPCVYSEYGLNMLKKHVEKIRYFRPMFDFGAYAEVYDDAHRAKIRKELFKIGDDKLLFGFIGQNQFRKDPQRVLKAFELVKDSLPDALLYMHTNLNSGVFNLTQYAIDCDLRKGSLLTKDANAKYSVKHMVDLYNSFDCLVSASMQEGLSWTILEAMACGCPVIAPKNSAHTELLVEYPVAMACHDTGYLPIVTSQGNSWVDTRTVRADTIAAHMRMMKDKVIRDGAKHAGLEFVKKWVDGIHSFNDLLGEVKPPEELAQIEKKQAVLFMQHSAAGDVFMTTRCFKGLKDRYNGLPIHYMTMPQYADLLKHNPYIDKVIEWDDDLAEKSKQTYQYVVNPHGERILPGHWGRNCNSILSDFYWKILRVEPDMFHISSMAPSRYNQDNKSEQELSLNLFMGLLDAKTDLRYAVVHTTGGDAHFRTYKYMADICEGLRDKGIITVQLGGKKDYPAGADHDFRGMLSYQESAWIMSKACAAVTVDSFMSHLAGALGISQVCLFGSGNENVVKPNQMSGKLICFSPDYVMDCKGLGPCSASVRDCPVPCTGYHNPKDILKALETII